MFDYFPQTDHTGLVDPIDKFCPCDRIHARPATTMKAKIWFRAVQSTHERRAMRISTRLARDEIECLWIHDALCIRSS